MLAASVLIMPPMPRRPSRTDLPPHLYESGGYYSWRDPNTGKTYGIGRDRALAIEEAKKANAFAEQHAPDLVSRLATPERTLASFLPKYREIVARESMAEVTRKHRLWQLVAIEKALSDMLIGPRQEDATEVTRRCAEWLATYVKAGKLRSAKIYRTALIDICAKMAAAGWMAVNPARVIEISAPLVRRSRLTLEQFNAIYEAAGAFDPWVRRSMELGLVSLQRREDIARMGFRDLEDDAQRIRVQQQKTGARIRIPARIRLAAVGWSLEEIIARCRDSVLSRRLVHHTCHQGLAKPGDAVHKQTITTKFREARELAGVKAEPGKTPPTYHELRSLGARLYKQQGYDPQALLGHRDPETTRLYTDSRGAEWIDVAA